MSLLIAEISTNHFGNMKAARELIRAANDSGADLIKSRAYRSEDIKNGPMPMGFYRHCQFSEDQCIELVHYARDLRNDLFFTIYSPGFERLRRIQRWQNMSPSQTAANTTMIDDTEYMVVSANRALIDASMAPRLKRAWVLYSTDSLVEDPKIEYLEKLRVQIGGPVGIADRTIGKDNCIRAVRWHNVNCVEKHFTLLNDLSWDGRVCPDTIHAALPAEFSVIGYAMH